jgi:hypothetical protein
VITLADIRHAGGLANIQNPSIDPKDIVIIILDAHANLNLLGSTVQSNAILIETNYTHIFHITAVPLEVFVGTFSLALGVPEATRMYVVAQAQTLLLNNQLTWFLANWANSYLPRSRAKVWRTINQCGARKMRL